MSCRKSAIQSASLCNCFRNSSGEVSPSAVIPDAATLPASLEGANEHWRADRLPASRYLSKGKAKAEMERAEIFIRVRIGIHAVVETNRTNRQLVTQTCAYPITHIVYTDVL